MSALLLLRSQIGPLRVYCQENSELRDECQRSGDLLLGLGQVVLLLYWVLVPSPQVYHARLWQHVQLLHCSFHTWPGEEPACCLHSGGSEEAFWAGEKFPQPFWLWVCLLEDEDNFSVVLQPVLSLSCTCLEPYLARKKFLGVHVLGCCPQSIGRSTEKFT